LFGLIEAHAHAHAPEIVIRKQKLQKAMVLNSLRVEKDAELASSAAM
jgi:hypothetical protein